MELMEVYHEAMAAWIIARVTSGKSEPAALALPPLRLLRFGQVYSVQER